VITDSQKWLFLAALILSGWILYRLAPVLTPFLIAALLAYLGDPLVDRLEQRGLSRTLAVLVVFVVLLLGGLSLILFMVPMMERQIGVLVSKIPVAIDWIQQNVLPRVASWGLLDGFSVDAESLRKALSDHWQQLGGAVSGILGNVFQSGQVALGWLMLIVLVPVLTFYILRDWDDLVASIRDLLPRKYEPTVSALAQECDLVLAEFLRGQLLVMLALAVIYSAGLWLVGLDLALLIGMLAGIVSFVPYLGFIVGIVPAVIAAVLQFQDAIHVVYVIAVFGAGQALEGMVLSPLLVGERIGLHPVAVIFAVMAGGQMFGFFGVLLALPVAAVVVVLLRHARELYVSSGMYTP